MFGILSELNRENITCYCIFVKTIFTVRHFDYTCMIQRKKRPFTNNAPSSIAGWRSRESYTSDKGVSVYTDKNRTSCCNAVGWIIMFNEQ